MSSSDSPLDVQRWRLDIAYDGNAFSGFAYQPEFTTVVGVLRETLANTLSIDERWNTYGQLTWISSFKLPLQAVYITACSRARSPSLWLS